MRSRMSNISYSRESKVGRSSTCADASCDTLNHIRIECTVLSTNSEWLQNCLQKCSTIARVSTKHTAVLGWSWYVLTVWGNNNLRAVFFFDPVRREPVHDVNLLSLLDYMCELPQSSRAGVYSIPAVVPDKCSMRVDWALLWRVQQSDGMNYSPFL